MWVNMLHSSGHCRISPRLPFAFMHCSSEGLSLICLDLDVRMKCQQLLHFYVQVALVYTNE
jgi:hypothetical protein